MRIASVTEAKSGLSASIDSLKGGSPVLIVDRPVAWLEPVIGDHEEGQDGRLARLVCDGLVRPRRVRPYRALFNIAPPRTLAGASAVDTLIEARREGR